MVECLFFVIGLLFDPSQKARKLGILETFSFYEGLWTKLQASSKRVKLLDNGDLALLGDLYWIF